MNLAFAALAMLAAQRFLVIAQRNANFGRLERALAYAALACALGFVGAVLAWVSLGAWQQEGAL